MSTRSTTDPQQHPGRDEADRLLNEHLGLVHHIARQLSASLSTQAEFDELVSAGTIGLMQALSSYDPTRGLTLSTFAAPRIRGAILDELRRQDDVPRSIRRKTRQLTAARQALMRTLGREPHHWEMADHLDIDLETYWRWHAEAQCTATVSLERPAKLGDEGGAGLADILADSSEGSIEDHLNLEQETAMLREAILELKEQERLVLALYYFEELKQREIASMLEITESRVSQIRTKALAKLRAKVAPLRDLAA